jgi:hypothetical protein
LQHCFGFKEFKMQWLVWLGGVVILALWSGTVWLGHAAASLVMTLPWDQAVAALRQIEMPALLRPFLEPFLGGAWSAWVDALAPLLQATGQWIQGSSQWIVGALPVLAWLIWALGSLVLLAMLVAASAGIWFIKRQRLNAAGQATSHSGASRSSIADLVQKFRSLRHGMLRS